MTEEELPPLEINPSVEAYLAQINEQAGSILNLQIMVKELIIQVRHRDALLAEKTKTKK